MKIYSNSGEEKQNVEILLSYKELIELVRALKKFEDSINEFKKNNNEQEKLGFTHLHYKDYYPKCSDNKTDIIFYVNLDEK